MLMDCALTDPGYIVSAIFTVHVLKCIVNKKLHSDVHEISLRITQCGRLSDLSYMPT